ncbi:hypothetical protein DI09_93p110 [Mitosporidium daphniae]|uniref:Uncharacterized protein n=1 Tax=Mitosporidium daphniae TaxID=1485682 RepID=A0A098VM52_9MICR|nr:uncharacterized protein DI09_93p110 [Mitosporidium daphniae]KGG50025.1 hypothetical protein DI09_93p110 [Mitosporidium daphniae]|eukprot:XP_013236461.1 uncharacterized protein DI09_93p110 [Mitosporidium daphniae]
MSLVQNSSTIFGERQDLHASLKSLRSANRTNEQEGATGETLARKSNAALSKVYRPKLDLLSAASLNEIAQPTIKTKSISMITSDDLRILQDTFKEADTNLKRAISSTKADFMRWMTIDIDLSSKLATNLAYKRQKTGLF